MNEKIMKPKRRPSAKAQRLKEPNKDFSSQCTLGRCLRKRDKTNRVGQDRLVDRL